MNGIGVMPGSFPSMTSSVRDKKTGGWGSNFKLPKKPRRYVQFATSEEINSATALYLDSGGYMECLEPPGDPGRLAQTHSSCEFLSDIDMNDLSKEWS